jgi:hypothetical protein
MATLALIATARVRRPIGILTETDLLREIVRAEGCCCPEVEAIVVAYP